MEEWGTWPWCFLHMQLNQRLVLVPAIPCPCRQRPFIQWSRGAELALAMATALLGDFMELSAPGWAPFPSCLSS